MGQRFNPRPIARYDQSLIPVLNDNFEQLKRLLASIPTESIGATAPDSPYVGQSWYDTNTLSMKFWNGTGWSSWTSFTPVISQSVVLTKTVNYSKYKIIETQLTWVFDFSITSAGTAGQNVLMSCPLNAVQAQAISGSFSWTDNGTEILTGVPQGTALATVQFLPGKGVNSLGISGLAGGAANGDRLTGLIIYELA